ncbi:DNRLRE domain-containing protein [Pseudonocardia sp. Cha107L01]|uniref:DNRLRE domain-containing protein n=1 Tax=Pseudonocardia sp. Cha107L01 TaxID=3457576 RepID=UPI00403E3C3D
MLERAGAVVGLLLSLAVTTGPGPQPAPVPGPPPTSAPAAPSSVAPAPVAPAPVAGAPVAPAPVAGAPAPTPVASAPAAPGGPAPGASAPGGPAPGASAPGGPAPGPESMTVAGPVAGPRPVEIPDQRSETVTAFRHPDGARTVVFSSGPIRLHRGAAWLPVDLTLHRDPDGGIRPIAHPDTLWLSGGGHPADAAAVRGPDGSNIALPWNAPLPAPRLTGSRAVYPNARPGADLVIEATRTGFVATLESVTGTSTPLGRATTPGAARHPAPAAAAAPPVASAPAATPPVAPAPAAPPVAAAEPAPPSILPPAPMAEAPAASPATPAASAGGAQTPATPVAGQIATPVAGPTARPAATPTAAPAVAPLTLRVTHPGATADALPAATTPELMTGPPGAIAAKGVLSRVVATAAGQLSLPFSTTVQSTVPGSDLSGDPDIKLGSYDGHSVARSFLSWDLSRLRGQRVMAATLRLYADWSSSCQASGWEVWASPPVGPATRWANQPAGDRAWASSTATNGHDAHCQPGWTSVDLTDLVKGWVQAGASSGTVLLRAANESDPLSWKRFSSGAGPNVPALGVTLAP